MEPAAAMEPSTTVEAAGEVMAAAEARLSAEGVGMGHTAVIVTAERVGMARQLGVGRSEVVNGTTMKCAAAT
jgi:hypothetical protein